MMRYTLTVFAGSTMLTHESSTMWDVVHSVRDLAAHMPQYKEAFGDNEKMDNLMESMFKLRDGKVSLISMSSPFLRIECNKLPGS